MSSANITPRTIESRHRPRTLLTALLLLGLFAGLAFSDVMNCDFVNYDDPLYIYENPELKKGLSIEGIKWAFLGDLSYPSAHIDYWQPLTLVSRLLDYELFGLDPSGHHLTNLIVHTCNSFLLFLIFFRATEKAALSGLVALLFAIHPLHVESVAWVTERKDVLSAFFGFLSISTYLNYNSSRLPRYYFATMFFQACALMSKPSMVILPGLYFLLDYWPSGKLHPSNFLRCCCQKVPFLVLSILSAVLTIQSEQSIGSLQAFNATQRFGAMCNAYITYLQKIFFPVDLAVFYPWPRNGFPLPKTLLYFCILMLITWLVIVRRRSQPYLLVGWGWFVLTLLPMIGIVKVGAQFIADRYTYVAMTGICMMILWGTDHLLQKPSMQGIRNRKVLFVILAVPLYFLLQLSRSQVHVWQNSKELWSHAIAVTKSNSVAHNNLGNALVPEGRYAEAEQHFRKAIEINPHYKDALLNLGLNLIYQKKWDAALETNVSLLKIDPHNSKAYFNMGYIHSLKTEPAAAEKNYLKALELNPHYLKACLNLAGLYSSTGHLDRARILYLRALEIQPASVEAMQGLERLKKLSSHDMRGKR